MIEGIDFIRKKVGSRSVKYYRSQCPTCLKDKGFVRKSRLHTECHSCNSKRQAVVGKNHNGKIEQVREANRQRRKFQVIQHSEETKRLISESNKQTWLKKHGPPRSEEANKIRKSFSKLLSRYLRRRHITPRKCKSKFELLGYTPEELFRHIEENFQPGMSWDNYGEWHIDHIIPDCQFKYNSVNEEGFKLSWSLSNLQPLWAKDNLRKGGRRVVREE